MAAKRPTLITVLGILCIVFGGFGLCCQVVGGAGLAAMYKLPMPPGLPGAGPNSHMIDMYNGIPQFVPFSIVSISIGFVLTIVLLVSGIGLLAMKGWARWTAVTYSVLAILTQIAGLVYQITVLNPAMEKVTKDIPGANITANSMLSNISSIAGTVFGLAFSVVLLVMMLLPSVGRALSGREPPRVEADREGGWGDIEERQQ